MVSMDWHFFGTKVMNDPFMLFKDNKLGTLDSINLNFTTTSSCFTSLHYVVYFTQKFTYSRRIIGDVTN